MKLASKTYLLSSHNFIHGIFIYKSVTENYAMSVLQSYLLKEKEITVII